MKSEMMCSRTGTIIARFVAIVREHLDVLLILQQLFQARALCELISATATVTFFIFPLFRNSSLDSRGDMCGKIELL
jgi:hypothetical protein